MALAVGEVGGLLRVTEPQADAVKRTTIKGRLLIQKVYLLLRVLQVNALLGNLHTYMTLRRLDEQSSWIERYIKPLLTLCAFLAVVLGALQAWIASKFVTRDEMERLRTTLQHSHEDHMDDYRKIEEGMDELSRLMRQRLPRPKDERK